MAGPMFGLKVVELAEGIGGPYAAMEMGDAGADVVKIERPEGDRARGWGSKTAGDLGSTYLVLNRNKRGVMLDVSTPAGVAAAKKLTDSADVVVYDAGWSDNPELQPDGIMARNPKAVVLVISAFGGQGPWADYPPYAELGAQMTSEASLSLGIPGEPPVRIGNDNGSMYAAIYGLQAVCAALVARDETGGQRIDTSAFGTLIAMRSTLWAAQSNPDEWWGFHLDSYIKPPDYGYHCKDGAISFNLGRMSREERDQLYIELKMEWVKDDPLFKIVDSDPAGSGSRYGYIVRPIWERALKEFTRAEVIEIGRRFGATCFEKNDYEDFIASDQVKAVGMITTVDHPGVGPIREQIPPWEFSETPADIRMPAPRLGEHTTAVLAEIGM